jgi:hypothetical protein
MNCHEVWTTEEIIEDHTEDVAEVEDGDHDTHVPTKPAPVPVKTFAVRFAEHAHGDWLIVIHEHHDQAKKKDKWEGFEKIIRRRWKPCQFVHRNMVDTVQTAAQPNGSRWSFVNEVIQKYGVYKGMPKDPQNQAATEEGRPS